LALALKRLPARERLEGLLHRAGPGSWEHELAAEALAAGTQDARVAVVNVALAEAEHSLTRGAEWPRAGIRIALLGNALLAFAAYLSSGSQIKWSLSIAALGAVAALTCVEAGRSARRNADRQRRAIDDLVTVVFGDAASGTEAPVMAGRPLERRGRRSRGWGRSPGSPR
jgi:hypothetical protein